MGGGAGSEEGDFLPNKLPNMVNQNRFRNDKMSWILHKRCFWIQKQTKRRLHYLPEDEITTVSNFIGRVERFA